MATIHEPSYRIGALRRVGRYGRNSRPHPDFEQRAGMISQDWLIH